MSRHQITLPLLWSTLSLMIGIIVGYYFPISTISSSVLAQIGLSMGTGLLVLWILKKLAERNEKITLVFSAWMVLTFIGIGILLVVFHNPLLQKNHYSNTISAVPNSAEYHVAFRVSERLKPTPYYEKYRVALLQILHTDSIGKSVTGDVLLLLPKKQLERPLKVDEQYLTLASLQTIPAPLNPHQFDYSAYMKRQYLYHQIKTTSSPLVPIQPQEITLKGRASSLRNFLTAQLDQTAFGHQELAVFKALVLGQRQDIDPQTYTNYTKAGAIHILAVSGLHIGILLWLLNGLLYPLRYFGWGNGIRTGLIIVLLFGYAVLTGLSPSVLRAVTMFSCIAIGMALPGKKSNSYNALLISAFFLLCCQPLLLFDVGFQLSYLAIIAILWIQPMIAKGYQARYWLDRIYWDSFTVTIAAQLGLLPLSIFYFHQFPLLFFISNLIIVPFLGIILGFGILVLLAAALGNLPDFVAKSYNQVLWTMNTVIEWVATQESFLLTNIPLSWTVMCACYIMMVSAIRYFKTFSTQRFYRLAGSCILLIGVLIYEQYETVTTERLLLFHQPVFQKGSGNTLLGHQSGSKLTLYSSKKVAKNAQKHLLEPFKNAAHIAIQKEAKLQYAYRYKEKSIYIIDSTGQYSVVNKTPPDIIILSNTPRVHLERLLDSLKPQRVVADGSTYKSVIDRWQSSCANRKIAFHRTDRDGAFVLE